MLSNEPPRDRVQPGASDSHVATLSSDEIVLAELAESEAIDLFGASNRPTSMEVLVQPSVDSESNSGNDSGSLFKRILLFPFRAARRLFQFACLMILLAVASTIPILQLATLGYMFEAAGRLARTGKWRQTLPGLERAGRIGTIAAWAWLTWLPVWWIADFSYSAQLIDSQSIIASRYQIVATVVVVLWFMHVLWALLRGGRWYHFLWPAPMRFLRESWRASTWSKARDGLWDYTVGLRIPSLIWLGFREAIAGLAWLAIPASLMVVGLNSTDERPGLALFGVLGALMMGVVVLYLPFLQMNLAADNRLRSGFGIRTVREQFKRAPWSYFIALLLTLAHALPLYILRIEETPEEYTWLLCLVFVVLIFPAKLVTGWAVYRGRRDVKRHPWPLRYIAWGLQLAIVPFYIGFLYLALVAVWDGRASVFLQHAFLTPVPFQGN